MLNSVEHVHLLLHLHVFEQVASSTQQATASGPVSVDGRQHDIMSTAFLLILRYMSWLCIFAFMGSTRKLISMFTQVIFLRTFDLKGGGGNRRPYE